MKTRHLLTLAATGGLILTPLGLIAPAHAEGAGTFYVGVAEYGTERAVPGTQVTLYDTATGSAVATKTVPATDDLNTMFDERWGVVFNDLDAGTYTAKAHDPANKHADKYTRAHPVSDDSFSYDTVDLVPTTIEMGLISGTVVQDEEEMGARVDVYPSTATQASIESGDVKPVASTTIYDYDYQGKASSDWSVKVPGGQSYKVLVGDLDGEHCDFDYGSYTYDCTFESSVWVGPSGATADTATKLAVSNAKVTPAALVTLPGEDASSDARILGTVTGVANAKLDDVEVELFKQYTHGDETTWREVASDETGDDGTFSLSGGTNWVYVEDDNPDDEYDNGYWDYNSYTALTAGTYTVRFTDERGEYTTRYLGDIAPSEESSSIPEGVQTLVLEESDKETANITLPLGAAPSHASGIYGTLSDDAGKGHQGRVTFYDTFGNRVASVNTRRDGTWSEPATDLAPGQYKLEVDSADVVSGWVGGKTFKTARTVTLPVKGATNAGGSAMSRFATLAGTIAMPTVAGTDGKDSWVRLYGADGDPVDGQNTTHGSFSFRGVVPGTYYLAAGGMEWSSFDDSDAGTSVVPFIRQFWKGRYTVGSATPITVGSGGKVSGLNMTLGNKLLATTAARITGTGKVGSTLRASTGVWNVTRDVAFSYTWKRGSTVVGRSSSYKVVKADAGKSLTLVVTATDTNHDLATGTSTAKAVKVAAPKPPKKKKRRQR